METAIDWSYRLLDRTEQCLLRHLGVFPSSFDVRAVQASAPRLPGTVPDTVFGQLVDKSLVVHLPGSGRYRLLETIRVFARDRLDESGEATAAFERHRRHMRERVGSASRLDRWMSARLGAEFRSDLEDSRQAFRLSLQHGDVGDAVEIAIGASFLWRNAMGCAEADTWIDDLLSHDLSPRDELWVQLLRADVGQGRGDARQMFDAACSAGGLVDRTGDPAGACLAAHFRALAHLTDPDQAPGRLAAARDLAHQSGDARLIAMIEAFLAAADVASGQHDQVRAAVAKLERAASALADQEGYHADADRISQDRGAKDDPWLPGPRRRRLCASVGWRVQSRKESAWERSSSATRWCPTPAATTSCGERPSKRHYGTRRSTRRSTGSWKSHRSSWRR